MASQFLRRASRGWEEMAGSGVEVEMVVVEGPSPWRRVSWTPGADGAEEVWVV